MSVIVTKKRLKWMQGNALSRIEYAYLHERMCVAGPDGVVYSLHAVGRLVTVDKPETGTRDALKKRILDAEETANAHRATLNARLAKFNREVEAIVKAVDQAVLDAKAAHADLAKFDAMSKETE